MTIVNQSIKLKNHYNNILFLFLMYVVKYISDFSTAIQRHLNVGTSKLYHNTIFLINYHNIITYYNHDYL